MARCILITLALANVILLSSGCQLVTFNSSQTTGLVISSSGYPQSSYKNLEVACWLFAVESGSLSITPKDVFTERCCDKVTVYDGVNENATLLGSIRGIRPDIGAPIVTSGRFMFVKFEADFSITAVGFQACVCPSNSICGCSYMETPTRTNRYNWNDWNYQNWGYESRKDDSELSRSDKAGIGIGIFLFVVIPIVIGVSVACCCGGACKKTTQSPNTYAEQRRREKLAGAPFTDITGSTDSGLYRDRKHNQVRPWVVAHPPGYTSLNLPPAYPSQSVGYGSPHEMLMAAPPAAATNRVLLPPLVVHGTPQVHREASEDTQTVSITRASGTAPLNTSFPTEPPRYTSPEPITKKY